MGWICSSFGGSIPRAFNKLDDSLDICVGDLDAID